jgi:cytoskeleton protein RodZ
MNEHPDDVNPIKFGAWLKARRQEKNISLEEIAAVTKVHISQFKMMEEDQWTELPAPAFVRGFLLCYSRHINLDDDEVLKRYKEVVPPQLKSIEASLPEGYKSVQSATKPKVRVASSPNFKKSPGAQSIDTHESPWLTPRNIGIVAAILILLVLLSWLISMGRKASPAPEASPAPAKIEAAPEKATEEQVSEAPAPAPSFNLELIGVEDSWVNVRIGDQSSPGFTLKAGEKRTLAVSPTVQIVLSNAGAVEIKWEGKHYAAPGFRGDVKTLRLPEQVQTLSEKVIPPRRPIAPRTTPSPAPPAETSPAASQLPGTLQLPGSAPSTEP